MKPILLDLCMQSGTWKTVIVTNLLTRILNKAKKTSQHLRRGGFLKDTRMMMEKRSRKRKDKLVCISIGCSVISGVVVVWIKIENMIF